MHFTFFRNPWMAPLAIVLLFTAAQAGANCLPNYHVRPAEVVADDVNKLFKEKNFAQLEALATKYQKEKTATFDHVAALFAFHQGIAQEFNACTKVSKTSAEWDQHAAIIQQWNKQFPQSVVAKLVAANHTIDAAWRARGSGFSNSVGSDQRNSFQALMSDAARQLQHIEKASKNNPAWYAAMMKVGLAQGADAAAFRKLFDTAAKLDPYYIDFLYTNVDFFAPQWYGDEEQMKKAIEQAVSLTSKKMGQTMYARLYWTQRVQAMAFRNGAVSWPKMKEGFDDFIRIYPEMRARNGYAWHACAAGDGKTAKVQLDLIGEHMDKAIWNHPPFVSYCKALVKNSDSGKEPQCWEHPNNPLDVKCE